MTKTLSLLANKGTADGISLSLDWSLSADVLIAWSTVGVDTPPPHPATKRLVTQEEAQEPVRM